MSEIDYMNECTARDLIVMLSEEYQIAPSEAMDILYNSETKEMKQGSLATE